MCHIRAYPNLIISLYKISLFKLHFGDGAVCVYEGYSGYTYLFASLQMGCIYSWIEIAEAIRKVLTFHSELDVDAVSASAAAVLLHSQ